MILTATQNQELHPAGVFNAVCVDIIDLGLEQSNYSGKIRPQPKVRFVFETELPDGRRGLLSRKFTASLNQKARLAEFIGKWRGRTVMPGESVNTDKCIGASATLVVSHVQSADGPFAGIDAISRPTKTLPPSGAYNPQEARRKIQEQKQGAAPNVVAMPKQPAQTPNYDEAVGF